MSKSVLGRLRVIAPGFLVDRDEGWMANSEPVHVNYMRKNRLALLNLIEQREDAEKNVKYNKANQMKDCKEIVKKLNKKIHFLVCELLEEIPKLKKKAQEARDDAIAADFGIKTPGKRPRLVDNQLRDVNLDYVASDDFMPRSTQPQRAKQQEPARKAPLLQRPQSQSQTSRQNILDRNHPRFSLLAPGVLEKTLLAKPPPDQKVMEDPFLQIKPDNVKIMKPYRMIIARYNCAERVNKAMFTVKMRHHRLEALSALKSFMQKYRERIGKKRN